MTLWLGEGMETEGPVTAPCPIVEMKKYGNVKPLLEGCATIAYASYPNYLLKSREHQLSQSGVFFK